ASYEHALTILEEVLDPDDPVRFDTYHGLAHAYHDTKQFDKAETYFKRSLDFLEHNLSGKPSEVADALENVARLYRDLGQFEKAEPYYKRIIELRNAEGEQRPEALDTLREVAQFYTAGGKYQNALSLYEDVLRVQEASNVSFDSVGALLDYFRATADTYSAMGEVHLRMGDDEQAEASFKLARRLQNVALKLRQFGAAGEHAANEGEAFRNMLKKSDVAADFEEIAGLYTQLRRDNNAARFYSLLAAAQESNGDLLGAGQSRLKGARILSEQLHDTQSAFLNYSEVIASLRSKKAPNSAPLVAEALAGLARIYTGESHDFVKAEEHLKAALAVLAEVPPSERSELAAYTTLSDLAGLYKRLGREEECVAANRKRLAAASALLTKNPSNSSDEHGAPADTSPAQKIWEGDAYTEVFALYIRAVSDLSESLAAWGKPEEADKVFGELLDPRLDPVHVLDKGVLDSYADMLTRHADVLASIGGTPGFKPENRAEAKLRAAREQKAEIEQITARQ
ncbi:MAG TPA: tetratricopeptide repeat protein, partial [Pyrinomonadaceae bacterium]|nr:tetratricopeptide repeat protein [Pyrinomonadaceae bacterium]